MTHPSFFEITGWFFHRGHYASIHQGGTVAKIAAVARKQWKVSRIIGQR